MADSGSYTLRIVVLKRIVYARTRANEPKEVWQEPAEGGRYSARRLNLTAGEEIRQGVKEGVSYLKLEIRGQSIPIAFDDHVRLVVGGEEYRVTADPVRMQRTTVITCESWQHKPSN